MRRPLILGAIAVLGTSLAAIPSDKGGLHVYWIDVEGGAATLVVTPAGESVLVDTGWPGERDADRIQRTARAAGVERVDHLITTHWHTDHYGGVPALAERLPIGRFYDHGFAAGEAADIDPKLKTAYLQATKNRSTILAPGNEIALRQAPGSPSVSLLVVASNGVALGEVAGAPQTRSCPARPPHEAIPDDTTDNFRSLGLRMTFGGFAFLDLGDLTWNVEHKLACPKNLLGNVDVYQVTHHGSDNSNNPALVAAVSPTVAVINNGAKKGGTPVVYRTLRRTPSIKDIFQLHRNVETTPADNAPAELVANDDEACLGQGIELHVNAQATSYTVKVSGKGTERTYPVKSTK